MSSGIDALISTLTDSTSTAEQKIDGIKKIASSKNIRALDSLVGLLDDANAEVRDSIVELGSGLRFVIGNSSFGLRTMVASCGFLGRNGDCYELVRLVLKPVKFREALRFELHDAKLRNIPEHFEPETGFVCFLLHRAEFRDEVGLRFRAAVLVSFSDGAIQIMG